MRLEWRFLVYYEFKNICRIRHRNYINQSYRCWKKIRDQINVLGIGNQRSEGVSRGIIVDIDRAAGAIKKKQ